MKKVFNIIIIICVLATIGIVAFDFLHDLEAGYKIYTHTYYYTQNLNSKSLVKEIEDCSEISKSVLAGTPLTEQQLSYLDCLAESISKLDQFEYSLSLSLISDKKKSAQTSKIIKSISELSTLRDELLFETDVYQVKMSGNTIGDPQGTYSHLIEKILNFVNKYNLSFNLLKDYVCNKNYNFNQTKLNIFDIYNNGLQHLCDSYNKDTLSFNNNAYNTITKLNFLFCIENNNIKTSVVGGVYSTTAANFNTYYSKIDKKDFIKNFHLKSYDDINISTEKQLDTITYYYLITLLEVN